MERLCTRGYTELAPTLVRPPHPPPCFRYPLSRVARTETAFPFLSHFTEKITSKPPSSSEGPRLCRALHASVAMAAKWVSPAPASCSFH